MRSLKLILTIISLSALILACKSNPEPGPAAPEPPPASREPVPPDPAFDPSTISEEVKRDTMEEVKDFIEEMNRIIRRKDYSAWMKHLTEDYVRYYSEASVLAEMSESTVLKRQDIVLKNLKDYFLHVVYPSRQSVRVDDIEFTSPVQVKAVTVAPSGDRQVYYYLEKVGESWEIGTGR